MAHLNIEIKARCRAPEAIRAVLSNRQAKFVGEDHQIDTYYQVNQGRLKLREGNIENNLIHYNRTNQAGPKRSDVTLYQSTPGSTLKALLKSALGVKVVVDKVRAIYFIENVKFHLDQVKGLGDFVEIEAIDVDGNIGEAKLLEQCRHYMDLFKIKAEDLIEVSYSDMLLAQK